MNLEVQCIVLPNILDLVYIRFTVNVQRVHPCTYVPAVSRLLEPFGEVGGDIRREKMFEK